MLQVLSVFLLESRENWRGGGLSQRALSDIHDNKKAANCDVPRDGWWVRCGHARESPKIDGAEEAGGRGQYMA